MLLDALSREVPLEWLALMDPTAGRLDDFQVATPRQLDVYQVKWSHAGGQIAWGELKGHLRDIIAARRVLADQYLDRRVLAHLTMDRVPSSSRISHAPKGAGAFTTAGAVAELLAPAAAGRFASQEELPQRWQWLWDKLASACKLDPHDLLTDFQDVRLEFGQLLPKDRDIPGRDLPGYRRDIDEITNALVGVARDPEKLVRLTREQFIGRLPAEWRRRLELVAIHDFPVPAAYEPITDVAAALAGALESHLTGFVALVGSPGAGKSTLLTKELRHRSDVVARYYAYVRGRGEVGSQRAEASNFLHDLVLMLERSDLPRGPGPVDFDLGHLSHRLKQRLGQLGRIYAEQGCRAIFMIDGLDHVDRADPTVSLLEYLPTPDAIPEGVLFVLGSQTLRMLKEEVRTQLREPGRTIPMQGLDPAAIQRLAEKAGVQVNARDLHQLTEGHPLLLDYVLRELAVLPPNRQQAALAEIDPYGGNVRTLYDRLWGGIRDDPGLVEVLALVSRIRSAIDLDWLRDRGQPSSVLRQLHDGLAHLFRRDERRWYFFHDSFRVYLQQQTATVGEDPEADPAVSRQYHRQLAAMCQATASGEPMHFEALFHLAVAEDHDGVLALATPDFFRQQLFALRPPTLISADISLAARSLGAVHDPMALVRLALAAGELSQRGYHQPERKKFLQLLLDTGHWRIAVDLLTTERDDLGSDDARTLPLEMAVELWNAGHKEEARRLFVDNEPLDVLAGKVDRHAHKIDELLDAWASAALLLRGPDAVLEGTRVLDLSGIERWGPDRNDDITPGIRAWMLANAAETAEAGGLRSGAQTLRDALDRNDSVQRAAWVRSHLQQTEAGPSVNAEVLAEVLAFRPGQIVDVQRVWVAELLIGLGRKEEARDWIDDLEQPPPRESVIDDVWEGENHRYRLNRTLAALGDKLAGVDVVPLPASRHAKAYAQVARLVIDIAQLHGAAWAGEGVEPGAFMIRVERLLRVFAESSGDPLDRYPLRRSEKGAIGTLVWVASAYGEDHVRAYWTFLRQRWTEKPVRLLVEGNRAIVRLAATRAVAPAEIRVALQALIAATREHSEAQELGGQPDGCRAHGRCPE